MSSQQSVGSRYQNASWRAYDIAKKLLDEEAYSQLARYKQRLNVTLDDGTQTIVTTDRVQIIIGSAIDSALKSAERYGAQLKFNSSTDDYYFSSDEEKHTDADIVALFSGAHTSDMLPGLREAMNIFSWPELSSRCVMWLVIKESDKLEPYTARGGELGAETWHYTIESARDTAEDISRVRGNILTLLQRETDPAVLKTLKSQAAALDKVTQALQKKDETARFDYIFTNAPDNVHNRLKRDRAAQDGNVCLDGGYQVDIKVACKSAIDEANSSCPDLLQRLSTNVIVTGGDACVPPNPLAAYGATLACETAGKFVTFLQTGEYVLIFFYSHALTPPIDDKK